MSLYFGGFGLSKEDLGRISDFLQSAAESVCGHETKLTDLLYAVRDCFVLGDSKSLSTFVDATEEASINLHNAFALGGKWKTDQGQMYERMGKETQYHIVEALTNAAAPLVRSSEHTRLGLMLSTLSCIFATGDREALSAFLFDAKEAVLELCSLPKKED